MGKLLEELVQKPNSSKICKFQLVFEKLCTEDQADIQHVFDNYSSGLRSGAITNEAIATAVNKRSTPGSLIISTEIVWKHRTHKCLCYRAGGALSDG